MPNTQTHSINAYGQFETTPASLRFCEFINTTKVVLKWSLYGASGYMCYYIGINTVFDLFNVAVSNL
jgi:hypothetical protein